MIVLQEDRGTWPKQHFAFTVAEAEIERAADLLRERGVEVDGPHFHEWMPAKSIYFADPDGNDLELCAPMNFPRSKLRGIRRNGNLYFRWRIDIRQRTDGFTQQAAGYQTRRQTKMK